MLVSPELREGSQEAGTQRRRSHSAGAGTLEAWSIGPSRAGAGTFMERKEGGSGSDTRSRRLKSITTFVA